MATIRDKQWDVMEAEVITLRRLLREACRTFAACPSVTEDELQNEGERFRAMCRAAMEANAYLEQSEGEKP